MPQQQRKFKYQLDLLDEKRAFVVIALTDRLSQAGKSAAFNCLAHYNAERGYSWASVPKIAKESGYSSSSTKTVKRGLVELEEVGAFKIVWSAGGKGGQDNTHRCCPIMSWFRSEYDRLRRDAKIANENDEFADARREAVSGSDTAADQDDIPQAENPSYPGSEPAHPGFKTRPPRAENPTKRTQEMNGEKRTNEENIPERSASGMSDTSFSGRACGAGRRGQEKRTGDYQQTPEEAERDWQELCRVLSVTSEEAEHQPAKNAMRGAKVRYHQLLRSGVPSSQILLAARGYRDRKPVGQWQSGVAGFLAHHFDPEQLPDGSYPEDEHHAANDNHRYDRASGESYGSYGGECDLGAPF